jgi:hypothetical protein
VNLRYPNADNVQEICGLDPDTSCFANTRLEMLDGIERSTKVSVNRANSIENRLLKLLAYLDIKHPDEGWGTYTAGGALKWSLMIVAGQSVGGGHAALIARDHAVARVAMFSSPVDRSGPNQRPTVSPQPAPWLLDAHDTPSERYFGFAHASDEANDWELQWPGLGLGLTDFGPIVNVDQEQPPYRGSHALITGALPHDNPSPPPVPRNHSSIVSDLLTPLTDFGQPRFAPVWQYVCFA